jgi:hypothetical protein
MSDITAALERRETAREQLFEAAAKVSPG